MSKKILKLIVAIRESNKDSVYIYTNGQCYNFALILKAMFEDGEIHYSRKVGHVWFYYNKKYYDINGLCVNPPKDLKPLNHKEGHRPHRWSKSFDREHTLTRSFNGELFIVKDNKLV